MDLSFFGIETVWPPGVVYVEAGAGAGWYALRLSALRLSVDDNLSNDSATGFLLTLVGVLPAIGVVDTVFPGGEVLPPPNLGLSVGEPLLTGVLPPLNFGVLPGVVFGVEPPPNFGVLLGDTEGLEPPLKDGLLLVKEGFEPPLKDGFEPPLKDGLEPPLNDGRLPPPLNFPAYASPDPAMQSMPTTRVAVKNLLMVFIFTPFMLIQFPEALRSVSLHICGRRLWPQYRQVCQQPTRIWASCQSSSSS